MRFSVLAPDATLNYITNPSLRYDTTGWTAGGATLTRTLEAARFGVSSLKVVTLGSSNNEGAFFRVSALSGVSEPITVSVYVRGTGLVRIRLDNNVVGGTEYSSQPATLRADRWTRIWVTGYSTGGNDLRLFVETDEGSPKARTFYVDGAQLERKSYPTTYCDGDQPGCRWGGIYHASTSSRDANTRAGGKWVQLSGEERESQDLYTTVITGLGVAPLDNHTQPYALQPGSFFQNSKTLMRPISMVFHAKHKVDDTEAPVSLSALHALRQMLIDLLKPDRTGGDEDIWFEYFDGTIPVYFQARYDGGLEGDWDIRNQFINSFNLKLIAVSPPLLEDSQDVKVLDFQDTIPINFVAARIDGRWGNMNFGFNDDPSDILVGLRGILYAVGNNGLTTVNNNAAAVDPLRSVRAITSWDGEKWNVLGPLTALLGGGAIYAVIQTANGDLYVTGDFSSIGGVAANYIAKWNGSVWSALGTGLNNYGLCLAVGLNGDLFVGGNFSTAGGISTVGMARWDGLQWNRVGQYGGLNSSVQSLCLSGDGRLLYVAGDFTDQNGNPGSGLNYVAIYNVESRLFSAMGAGFNTSALFIKQSPSGDVYAGGTFTASAGATMRGIARWNGTIWNALGGGIAKTSGVAVAYGFAFLRDGSMIVGGFFDTAGGIPCNNLAMWNDTTWFSTDADFNSVSFLLNTVITNPVTDDIYLGANLAMNQLYIAGQTLVTNPGTTEVYPVIYLKGPGNLKWIENQSTKKRMIFNLMILNGEEILIDPSQGTIRSLVRGNLSYSMLSGSDFRSFTLIPGENRIVSFMIQDVGAQMQISFRPSHWSADATAGGN